MAVLPHRLIRQARRDYGAVIGDVGVLVSRPLAVLLAPVLVPQGRWVRRRTPVLPEAAGERAGLEGQGGDPLRLVVLGESPAAGVGVADQRDGLARGLAAEIARRRGSAVAWTVCARTGATAGDVARDLVPVAPTGQDVAVVVLGVNDSLRLRSRRAWREQVGRLLDDLAPHLAPGGRVVLTGVPDLGAFPSLPQPLRAVLGWRARALDRQLLRLAGGRSGVQHVPGPPLTGPEMFSVDAFHPNADSYARWAAHLAGVIG